MAHDNGALRDPDRSRWTISASLATELLAADQPDAALDALKDAVAVDCLHPEAWRAALDVDDAPLPEPLRGWWRHVAAVLAGDTPVPPERAPTTLSREALDALHPGGAGWLDSLRHAVDTTAPPERATLVRGLDRVEATRAAWVADCVSAIAERLGMEPPPTYLFRGDDAYGASGWPTEPPVLLVGALHFVEGDRAVDRQALAFPIAVEMAHLACGHPVLAFGHGLVGTGRSVYQVFGRFAGTAEVVVDVLTLVPGVDQLTKLQTVVGLARKVFTTKGTLDKASGLAGPVLKRLGLVTDGEGGHAGREALAGAALQFRMQADRAALLATGDLEAAVRGVLWTSTRSSGLAERVREEGLASLLAGDTDGDDALSAADALRLSALVAFAATL